MRPLPALLLILICTAFTGCSPGSLFSRNTGERDEPAPPNEPVAVTIYRVQVGMYDTAAEAKTAAESVRNTVDEPVFIEYIAPFYRVQAGEFDNTDDAEAFVNHMRQQGFEDARYVFKRTAPQ